MGAGEKEMLQLQICWGREENDFLHHWESCHCFGLAVAAVPAPPAGRDPAETEMGSSRRISDVLKGR